MSRLELIEALKDIYNAAVVDDRESFEQWRQGMGFPEGTYNNYHAALVGYIQAVAEDALQRALGEET